MKLEYAIGKAIPGRVFTSGSELCSVSTDSPVSLAKVRALVWVEGQKGNDDIPLSNNSTRHLLDKAADVEEVFDLTDNSSSDMDRSILPAAPTTIYEKFCPHR